VRSIQKARKTIDPKEQLFKQFVCFPKLRKLGELYINPLEANKRNSERQKEHICSNKGLLGFPPKL